MVAIVAYINVAVVIMVGLMVVIVVHGSNGSVQ